MAKKVYDGLNVLFVPIKETDIMTTSVCEVVSVQYYVGQSGWSECTTTEGDGDGEGYSYNWSRRPQGM